jgi:IS4 transposase
LRGNIPSFVLISQEKIHDVKALDFFPINPGAFYLIDRGYLDYKRLYRIHQAAAFFITRLKDNSRFRVVESFAADKSAGILCEQAIRLTGAKAASAYPERLRRVKYRDPGTNTVYEFLTNNFTLPARIIAQLCKQRWQVELFFKWIKQHLRIKAFLGVSENTVRIQTWTALTAYLLLSIVKKHLFLPHDLHEMTQILRLHLFEKYPFYRCFPHRHRKYRPREQINS